MTIRSRQLKQYAVLFLATTCFTLWGSVETLGVSDPLGLASASPSSSRASVAADPFLEELGRLMGAVEARVMGSQEEGESDRERPAHMNITQGVIDLCLFLTGKASRGLGSAMAPASSAITAAQRRSMVDACLKVGVFYRGEYLKIAHLFLKGLPRFLDQEDQEHEALGPTEETFSGPEQRAHQINCAALALIASMHAMNAQDTGTVLARALQTKVRGETASETIRAFAPDVIQEVLRAVNALQRNPRVMNVLPRFLQAEETERRLLQAESISLWQEMLARQEGGLRGTLRTLETGASLTPADEQHAQRVHSSCSELVEVATRGIFSPVVGRLQAIRADLNNLKHRGDVARAVLNFPLHVRRGNVAELLGLLESLYTIEPPAPLGPRPTREETARYDDAKRKFDLERPKRLVLTLPDVLRRVVDFQARALTSGNIDGTLKGFLRAWEREVAKIRGAYPRRVSEALRREEPRIFDFMAVAGSPIGLTRDKDGTPDVEGYTEQFPDRIGEIPFSSTTPADNYVSTDAVRRAYDAYLAEEAAGVDSEGHSTAIPYNHILAIFDQSFPERDDVPERSAVPERRAVPESSPYYIAPASLKDYSAMREDGSGGELDADPTRSIALARQRLETLLTFCDHRAHASSFLSGFRYNLKRAFHYFKDHPDQLSKRHAMLLALVSAGGHCPTGQDEAAQKINKMIYPGGDPQLAGLVRDQSFVGKVAQVLFELRESVFGRVVQFPDAGETGTTPNNYLLRFKDILRVRDGDPDLPGRAAIKAFGFMGEAVTLPGAGRSIAYNFDDPSDPLTYLNPALFSREPDHCLDLDAYDFLSRFFYGKKAEDNPAQELPVKRFNGIRQIDLLDATWPRSSGEMEGARGLSEEILRLRPIERARSYEGYTLPHMIYAVLRRINVKSNRSTGEIPLVAEAIEYLATHPQGISAYECEEFMKGARDDPEGTLQLFQGQVLEIGRDAWQSIARALQKLPEVEALAMRDALAIPDGHFGDTRTDVQKEEQEEVVDGTSLSLLGVEEAEQQRLIAAAQEAIDQAQARQREYEEVVATALDQNPADQEYLTTIGTDKFVLVPVGSSQAVKSAACLRMIQDLLRSPDQLTEEERESIVKRVFFRFSEVDSAVKITPQGVLKILLLTGHVAQPAVRTEDLFERVAELIDINPWRPNIAISGTSVPRYERNLLARYVSDPAQGGNLGDPLPVDLQFLKKFARTRMQSIVAEARRLLEVAKSGWDEDQRQSPSAHAQFAGRLTAASFTPFVATQLNGIAVKDFELKRVRHIISQTLTDGFSEDY